MAKQRNTFDQDEYLDQAFDFNQLKRIIGYITPYKGTVLKALLVVMVSTMGNLVTPLFFKVVIDDYIPQKDIRSIIQISIAFLIIVIISAICQKYRIRYMSRVGQDVIRDLRRDLFTHIQRLPFTFFDSRPHGKILVRVVNYINTISQLLTDSLISIIVDMFSFVVAVALMFMLSWRLTAVIMVFVPICTAGIFYVKNKQRKSMQEVSAKQSNMNAYIHESISGMKVTQSFTREEVNLQVFDELMNDYRDKWMTSRRYMGLVFPIVKNASVISQCAMLLVGLTVLRDQVTPGVIVAILGYMGNFWMPLLNLSEFYNQLVSASAYLERIFETMDIEPEIQDKEGATELKVPQGGISFDHIEFGYEEGQVILDDFDLQIQPGERIALVGPTGAGKTTVVNLISRFYDVRKGAVRIDGQDVKEVTLASLRSQMGVMMQDTFIFSGTIMDNLRYGKLDATDDEVIAAAKAVRAHEFIIEMEDGYESEVNERGSRLSTGQRQLISFARALLMDPKILILDEATSSIDTQTEVIIQESLEKLLKGRTSIVIAHRLSTIKNSDRILVINNKGIEEVGSHEELIETEGHYFDLYNAQKKFLETAI